MSLQETISLVNESYPSECIRFRSVLSPSQARFRVEGIPEDGNKEALVLVPAPAPALAQDPAPASTTVPVSAASLPLKPSRRDQEQTPEPAQPPTKEAINDSRPASEVVARSSVPEGSCERTRQRDALDDIIAEAKATSHLVGTTPSSRESSD